MYNRQQHYSMKGHLNIAKTLRSTIFVN